LLIYSTRRLHAMNFDQRFRLSLEETQMRTLACRVFALYLALAGTAVAASGGTGAGLSSSAFVAFRPQYHYRHHHYAQHLERKTVTRRVAKAEHHHLRPSGYAQELTPRHNVSFETSITQMRINKTYALAPGTPLLGLDPRSPSTWGLYSEMLPFIFSGAPSDFRSVDSLRRGEEDTGK
jgi:hypothetical protein